MTFLRIGRMGKERLVIWSGMRALVMMMLRTTEVLRRPRYDTRLTALDWHCLGVHPTTQKAHIDSSVAETEHRRMRCQFIVNTSYNLLANKQTRR